MMRLEIIRRSRVGWIVVKFVNCNIVILLMVNLNLNQ
jgi:hypothetical protein